MDGNTVNQSLKRGITGGHSGGSEALGTVSVSGGERVGHPARDASELRAGQAGAPGPRPDGAPLPACGGGVSLGNPAGEQSGQSLGGLPCFDSAKTFDVLVAEHDAEVEYQGFLAELEEEHERRMHEESADAAYSAARPLFAFLAGYGEGVFA